MLNKESLKKIKRNLPKDGIQIVSERTGVGVDSVKKILTDPARFNKTVVETALRVIEEYKAEIIELNKRANELTEGVI